MNSGIYFKAGEISWNDFLKVLDTEGFAVIKNLLTPELVMRCREKLEACITIEAERMGTTAYKDYCMLPACPIYGGAFLDIAEHRGIMEPFNKMLGDGCIIYVYTSSSLPPGSGNYATRIHVDRPHFIPGYIESLGCLILLDDFTEENGGTLVLPGSHKHAEAPEESLFYQHAERIIAPAGSVFYFNLRLWHTGGVNYTSNWRHALGIGMVRGYMKQRIDLPRAMKNVDLSKMSDFGLQKLGFYSQPPTSLEEYYAPPQERTYRQRSEWN